MIDQRKLTPKQLGDEYAANALDLLRTGQGSPQT